MSFLSLARSTRTKTHAAAPETTAGQQSVMQSHAAELDAATQVRILVEAAMEQSRFSETDAQLVVQQLAAELVNMEATLSDVRLAVQSLYQGDKAGAQDYLDYLKENGFPQPPQSAPVRTLDAQDQAIKRQVELSSKDAHLSAASAGGANTDSEHGEPSLSLYSGNLITELVANSAYSALIFGERRSGTSALLRAIVYDQLAKSGKTILDILDMHNGEWGGLEDIRLEDGSRIVYYHSVCTQQDIAGVSQKLISVEAEVRRRQRAQQNQRLTLSASPPDLYLFLIDGLSELHGALPGWRADRRSKHKDFSQAASSLRFVLCHGPAVGVCCIGTARNHDSCLCDAVALGETRLLFLGRVSAGRNGGYRAIDAAVEDKSLLPLSHERSRFRQLLTAVKQLAEPVIFTPSGVPRLGRLGNFGSYLTVDLLAHYQCALEGGQS